MEQKNSSGVATNKWNFQLICYTLLISIFLVSCKHEECALCTHKPTATVRTFCEEEGPFTKNCLEDKVRNLEATGWSCVN